MSDSPLESSRPKCAQAPAAQPARKSPTVAGHLKLGGGLDMDRHYELRRCDVCGAEFIPTYSKQHTCSPSCRRALKAQRERQRRSA